jgi:hypothetical protein
MSTNSKSKNAKSKGKPAIIGLPKNPLFQAQRLEGKGPSFAIKSVSPKLKRGKRGDR